MATKSDIARVLFEMQTMANSPLQKFKVEDVVEMYFVTLKDLPVEILAAAALDCKARFEFFPQPGTIREAAKDLQVQAMQIPTATEAWGRVLMANKIIPAIDCSTGAELRQAIDGKGGGEYWSALYAHDDHIKKCDICCRSKSVEDYGHPAIEKTVKLLGGRDVMLTENAAADRARFIEAYREIIERETRKAAQVPEVRGLVDEMQKRLSDKQSALDTGEAKFLMRQLGDGMRQP